ncbi:MAG TPA: DNA-3-methyladenine glycosylase [Ignavibacteriaceae bacterium]|nr:DNA-3-methyladenine glycosylase [Ignavibacteriaceae bacterium]
MFNTENFTILTKKFYSRPVLKVARDLLGKILVKVESDKLLTGRIVEVEAYDGNSDQAAHSFNDRTERNEVMFREGGYFYVYFTYGVHHCCNVVTGRKDHGTAVLIRAIEPIDGIETMAKRRFGKKKLSDKEIINLTNGPGKICQAFGFTRKDSGADLTGNKIFLIDQPKLKKSKTGISERIGITKSKELKWRFFEIGNPYLSRK